MFDLGRELSTPLREEGGREGGRERGNGEVKGVRGIQKGDREIEKGEKEGERERGRETLTHLGQWQLES